MFDLKKNCFSKVGNISIENKQIKFIVKTDIKASGVYLWVNSEEKTKEKKIFYAGKAGFGPKKRMQQHEMGIKKNAERKNDIRKIITEYGNLEIWFRKSDLPP